MTREEAEKFYELHSPKLRGIAKSTLRKMQNQIEKIYDKEDLYQEMWCVIMTLPAVLPHDVIIQEALRLACMALSPARAYIDDNRVRVYEIPVDPDIIRGTKVDRSGATWEEWLALDADIERILDDFEYEVYGYLMARHPEKRRKPSDHRRHIVRNGWSIGEIADKLSVHRSTIHRIRNRIKEKFMRYLAADYDVVGDLLSCLDEC